MTQGHSVECAAAVRTTPDECQCTCQGAFHGGPHTGRARALVWEEAKRKTYSGQQVAAAKKKAREAIATPGQAPGSLVGRVCTDFAVTHAIDVLVLTGSSVDQDLAREVLKSVIDPFVTEIVSETLNETESRQIDAAVNEFHVLCSLCVAVLELVDETKERLAGVADGAAEAIVTAIGPEIILSPLVQTVLRRALIGSFNAAIDLLADPVKVKMLRLVGFVTCPDVSEHAEVETHCVNPLVGEWVTRTMQDWIDHKFQNNSRVFRRAAPQKRS